jgi:hypothetical protein
MGILATKPGIQKKIIVSEDKDMINIAAVAWNGEDLKQARLARTLRWSDWDKENRKAILWVPNGRLPELIDVLTKFRRCQSREHAARVSRP